MVRPLRPLVGTWSASAEMGTWNACETDGTGVCRAPKESSRRGTSPRDVCRNWRSLRARMTPPLSRIGVALTSRGPQKAPGIPRVRRRHSLTDCPLAAALSGPETSRDWWSGLGTPAGLPGTREGRRSGTGTEALRRIRAMLPGSTGPAAVNPVVPNPEEVRSQTLTCTERSPHHLHSGRLRWWSGCGPEMPRIDRWAAGLGDHRLASTCTVQGP